MNASEQSNAGPLSPASKVRRALTVSWLLAVCLWALPAAAEKKVPPPEPARDKVKVPDKSKRETPDEIRRGLAYERSKWQLRFEPFTPRMLTLEDADGTKHAYWYVTYHLTNPHKSPKPLLLDLWFLTEHGKRFDDLPLPTVLQAIEERYGRRYLSRNEISGLIKPGETKEGVAIFRRVDPAADYFWLYIRGLAAREVLNPDQDESTIRVHVLRFAYHWPGDARLKRIEDVALKGRKWLVREEKIKRSGSAAPDPKIEEWLKKARLKGADGLEPPPLPKHP